MYNLKIAVALVIYLIVLMPASFAQQTAQKPAGEPDFYTITSTSIIPSKGFDRRTVLDIDYPIYLQPRIRQKTPSPDVSITSKSAECSGNGISESYMINENTNSPYIVVKSSPIIADMTEPVKVECTLQLQIKKGKEILPVQESEKFTAQIPIYSNQLGTINENAQGQIDSINNRIHDLKNKEERWKKVNDVFAGIVTVAQYAAEMDKLANFLGSALWGISSVLYQLKDVPYIGPACKAISIVLWKTIGCGLINDYMHKFILRYVWNPGIVGGEIFSADADVAAGRIFVTLIKAVSTIYSCQLCDYGSSIYSRIQKSVYGDLNMNIEGTRGKPTKLETFTTYDWDPYRSIHVSMSCMCLPGLVYNMEKETQVNCIYRNCIEESAELGLPFDACQQIYKEQNCLYVDGAAWRVAGGTYIAPLLSGMLTHLFEQLPVIIIAKEWGSLCDPDCGCFNEGEMTGPKTKACGSMIPGSDSCQKSKNTAYPEKCAENPLDDWEIPLCGVWGSVMLLLETDYFGDNRYPWEKFSANLQGENYCD